MTSLTLITIAVMIYGALSRDGYWKALAIGGGTPIGAALIFGDTAVPTFYMAAVGAAVAVVWRMLTRTRRFARTAEPMFTGAIPLILFAVWAIVVTLVAQIFFVGMSVFLGPNPDSVSFISGQLSNSNVAQIAYMLLSIIVVFFLARSKNIGPGVVGVAAILVTLFSFWRFLNQNVGIPFPEGFFDNNTTYRFIETLEDGSPRFRGILAEPSGLALSSLVTISYCISRATYVRGVHRIWMIIVAAMAAIMAAVSTSTTFTVVAGVMVVLAGLAFLHHFLVQRGGVNPLIIVSLAVAAIASLWVIPAIIDLLTETIGAKVGTSSYNDRSQSDERAIGILIDSVGVGVGLGSNRPSSFVAALLSTTGIIGTVLLGYAIFVIIRKALPMTEYRPVVWAVVALLVSKIVSAPDLADSSGILWLSLGVLAYAGNQVPRTDSPLRRWAPAERRRIGLPA